jgi:hypothetical protein
LRGVCALRRLTKRNDVCWRLSITAALDFEAMLNAGEYGRFFPACFAWPESEKQLAAALGARLIAYLVAMARFHSYSSGNISPSRGSARLLPA